MKKLLCCLFVSLFIIALGSQSFAATDERLGNKADSQEKKSQKEQQDKKPGNSSNEDKKDRAETDRGRRPNDPKGVEIDQSTWKTDGVKP